MKRRGLSEIVGGIIILIALVAASFAITSTITTSVNEANNRFIQSIDTLLDQTSPLVVIPYITESNGNKSLRVYVSPVEPGEEITLFAITHNQTITRKVVAEGTVINTTIINGYSCEPIYILVERESGAIHFYNSLSDPRIRNQINIKDPRLFSCQLLSEVNITSPVRDFVTGYPLLGLEPPNVQDNITININSLYKIMLSGVIQILDNGSKLCSLKLTWGNIKDKTESCKYTAIISSSPYYSLLLRINETKRTVFGYLEIKPTVRGSIIDARLSTTLYALKRYYTNVPYYGTLGSITNTYLPIIYSPMVKGKLYSKSTIILGSYSYTIRLIGNSTADVRTTGPIVFLISTNKLKNYALMMTVNLNITKITIPISTSYQYPIGKMRDLIITTSPIVNVVPSDYLAEVINSINQEDWNLARPTLIVTKYGESRSYNIEQDTTIKLYDYTPFSVKIEVPGGYNLPPLTSYRIHESTWSSSNRYGYIIEGYTTLKPVVSTAHLPYIIEINYNNSKKYFIVGGDYKDNIPVDRLSFQNVSQYYILYEFGASKIDLRTLTVDVGCISSASKNTYALDSMAINSKIICSSSQLPIGSQRLYLIILIKYSTDEGVPRGVVYRLLWNS